MWWMVRFEAEISASVGGFSINFHDLCHPFPDDQNIQKRNHTACDVISIVNWMEGLKLLRWPREPE
jgi:hypothetical protein